MKNLNKKYKNQLFKKVKKLVLKNKFNKRKKEEYFNLIGIKMMILQKYYLLLYLFCKKEILMTHLKKKFLMMLIIN